jgi:site-specific DNA-methyltransferase (adenine-specific)
MALPRGVVVSACRWMQGDVFTRMRELPDSSVDLIVTSPPFLALRSYLPADHPDKHKEIGSEPTPAAFLSTLLALTREWRRILAPHGSIAVELGDTYSGSGGAGGDYTNDGGFHEGQPTFRQARDRNGWPLAKSLCLIPSLYAGSLAYGHNLLNPADRIKPWRIRNLIVWHRPNPPVGALGDKVRPSTSYITTACTSDKRWFDLDAERTAHKTDPATYTGNGYTKGNPEGIPGNEAMPGNPAGAPPLDCWLDPGERQWWLCPNGECEHGNILHDVNDYEDPRPTCGAEGCRCGKTCCRAGAQAHPDPCPWHGQAIPNDAQVITADVWTIPTAPYKGAHYATYPPALPRRLINLMCPREVCVVCGEPRRRIVERLNPLGMDNHKVKARANAGPGKGTLSAPVHDPERVTLGWTDCGHDNYRRGVVLDPFAGSGTTLAAAAETGRDAIGIDLDERNLELARQRIGLFLEEVS